MAGTNPSIPITPAKLARAVIGYPTTRGLGALGQPKNRLLKAAWREPGAALIRRSHGRGSSHRAKRHIAVDQIFTSYPAGIAQRMWIPFAYPNALSNKSSSKLWPFDNNFYCKYIT
jgi:hypothetical protein